MMDWNVFLLDKYIFMLHAGKMWKKNSGVLRGQEGLECKYFSPEYDGGVVGRRCRLLLSDSRVVWVRG